MDLTTALKKAHAVQEWVTFPGSTLSIHFKPLRTSDVNRVYSKAQKKNRTDISLLINEYYPKVILGFKGLTLKDLTDKEIFNLTLPEDEITDLEGNPLDPKTPINCERLSENENGKNWMISIGMASPIFHSFIVKHGGLVPKTEEDFEHEEDERKNS